MEERNGLGACRLPFRLSETRAIRRLLREWAWHYLVYPLTVSVYLERAEIKIPKRVFSHGGPCNGAVRKTRWIQNVHSHGVHREVESSDSRQGRECFEEEAKKTVKIIELLLSWSAVTVCRLFFIDSSRLLRLDNTFCIILFVDIYLLFVWDVIKKIFISYVRCGGFEMTRRDDRRVRVIVFAGNRETCLFIVPRESTRDIFHEAIPSSFS